MLLQCLKKKIPIQESNDCEIVGENTPREELQLFPTIDKYPPNTSTNSSIMKRTWASIKKKSKVVVAKKVNFQEEGVDTQEPTPLIPMIST